MRKPGKPWTEQDDEALKSMLEAGDSMSEIGNTIGRTRNSVIGRAHRLGIQSKKLSGFQPGNKKASRTKHKRIFKPAVVAVPAPDANPAAAPENPAPFFSPSTPVTFLELEAGRCKWPVGDLFCGERAIAGKPYCVAHDLVSYTAPKARVSKTPPRVGPRQRLRSW